MRIRELLAVESIDLNAKAANKKEALDHAVDLMARVVRSATSRLIETGYTQERKRAQPVLVRELPFLTANQML